MSPVAKKDSDELIAEFFELSVGSKLREERIVTHLDMKTEVTKEIRPFRLSESEELLWSKRGWFAPSHNEKRLHRSVAGVLSVTTERIVFAPYKSEDSPIWDESLDNIRQIVVKKPGNSLMFSEIYIENGHGYSAFFLPVGMRELKDDAEELSTVVRRSLANQT